MLDAVIHTVPAKFRRELIAAVRQEILRIETRQVPDFMIDEHATGFVQIIVVPVARADKD